MQAFTSQVGKNYLLNHESELSEQEIKKAKIDNSLPKKTFFNYGEHAKISISGRININD